MIVVVCISVHFWAPAWKWGLVVAGLVDLKRPAEQISVPQNIGSSCSC
jgi:hypothetical protein